MDHIYFIGIFQALFASIFFFRRRDNSAASKTAGLLMIFLALPLAANMLKSFFPSSGIIPFMLMQFAPFAYGPLLYTYTRMSIEENPRIESVYLLHLVPSACIAIIILSGLRYNPPVSDTGVSTLRAVLFEKQIDLVWLIKFIFLNTSYVVYTLLIIRMLNRHKRNIADFFSNESSGINLLWLRMIALLFIFCNIVISLLVLITPFVTRSFTFKPGIFVDYGLTIFIFIFSLFSGRQREIYSDTAKSGRWKNITDEPDRRYGKSGLKDEDAAQYLSLIQSYIENDRPYLDSELTIDAISKSTGIKRHYITQILNESLGVNFNTYINNYRIRYVIEKMKDSECTEDSILALALDAGFNSKATFNRVFKNYTGLTPSGYRQEVMKI